MQKCADIVVNWMIRNHAIDETDRELYIYAVESFIILLLPLVYIHLYKGDLECEYCNKYTAREAVIYWYN